MLEAENIILKIGNSDELEFDSVIITSHYSCQLLVTFVNKIR